MTDAIFRPHEAYAFVGICTICWSVGSWAIGSESSWLGSIFFGVSMFIVSGVVWGVGWLRKRYAIVKRKEVPLD